MKPRPNASPAPVVSAALTVGVRNIEAERRLRPAMVAGEDPGAAVAALDDDEGRSSGARRR